ncbi:MAG: CHAP domain-containing protein [Bacteroidetes bacterium]|nr:CHAP domain-containing protein [Bacteroidota bacterium]
MFAILFFGLVLLALSGCTAQAATPDQRECVVANALAEVGVREATGRNDGPEVERYLAHVGLGKGNAWCAAFVSYHLSGCGVDNPRSAWSPAFALPKDQVWTPRKASRSPRPGDVFSIYYPALGRVGHVGLVREWQGLYILTIEGNTSDPGSREGDGVYARRRQLSKCHAITTYIDEEATDGAGPVGLHRSNGRVALILPDPAGNGASGRATALGSTLRRVAARYPAEVAGGEGGSLASIAAAGHRPAAHYGAQRTGLEHGEHQPRAAHAQRGLRQHGHSGQAVGPLDGNAPGQGAHRTAAADRGNNTHAALGLVGLGGGCIANPVAAVAAAETTVG